jgi:hypothetical protein
MKIEDIWPVKKNSKSFFQDHLKLNFEFFTIDSFETSKKISKSQMKKETTPKYFLGEIFSHFKI